MRAKPARRCNPEPKPRPTLREALAELAAEEKDPRAKTWLKKLLAGDVKPQK